ncbi:serine/threonine/tyrosine-interacting-like protein 1 [Pezoporus wallicus]|uniref:serine/threonine/tyrosine-interacting-like protein 1 n=1 Tax=Pezoporus wallicus TaxID=35540 RepID=UPI00254D5E23|nr:serine/threonine/tyrosine-interacting-like protein 1 [Pezoporus wallicus]
MAGMELCEPRDLYNILNQHWVLPRRAEHNYLCLLDVRTQREYDESHILTARRIAQSPTGKYLVPDSEELACVRYCVVYDYETSSLDCCDSDEEGGSRFSDSSSTSSQQAKKGTAIHYAKVLEQFTSHPVLILQGGYKKFSACYHFLRTQRTLWMPWELANLQTYPVEILPAKLYMGNFKQAIDQQIQKDLKIQAQVNISEQRATPFADSDRYLHVSVPDTLEADLFSSFPTICHFIDAQLDHGAVLVFSSLGISRSSTGVMAYLIHSCMFSLKGAWSYVLKCKTNMRPHQGFVKQLLDWETKMYKTTVTDISELDY